MFLDIYRYGWKLYAVRKDVTTLQKVLCTDHFRFKLAAEAARLLDARENAPMLRKLIKTPSYRRYVPSCNMYIHIYIYYVYGSVPLKGGQKVPWVQSRII